uniref:Mannose-binding lectin n=1 Tax=Pandanus amaryllifolius TaxID=260201 RepID=F8UZX3_9LILI|nr:mannose-binding lectin [Pandanus amaryllifolius]
MACQGMKKFTAMVLALSVLVANSVVAEDTMFSGESLQTNQYLESGPYRFIMQGDCNLVLYVNKTRALWSSRTNGQGTACNATLQNNGNLVVLSGSNVVWTSNSARGPNNYRLIVQSDGNVVIYGAALWATNTVQSRKRLL